MVGLFNYTNSFIFKMVTQINDMEENEENFGEDIDRIYDEMRDEKMGVNKF